MPTPQDLKDCLRRNEKFSGAIFYDADSDMETLAISDDYGTVLANYDFEDVVRFIAKSNVPVLQDNYTNTVLFEFDITETEAYKNLLELDYKHTKFFRRIVQTNEQSILYALTYAQRLDRSFVNVQWNYAYVELLGRLDVVKNRLDQPGNLHKELILNSPLTTSQETIEEIDNDFSVLKENLVQEQRNILVTLCLIGFAIVDTNRFCISRVNQDKKHFCYTLAMSYPTSIKFNDYMELTLQDKS